MKRLTWLATILLVLFTAACGSTGKNFNEEMVQEIRNNQTTKSDILDWFGMPYKEGMQNGQAMWTYQFDKYMLGDTESKDLVILFDDQGLVKAFRFTSNTGVK
ncbi:MAG: outer membrane protein assembly factor BamE [Nitrospinaceae bacterium]